MRRLPVRICFAVSLVSSGVASWAVFGRLDDRVHLYQPLTCLDFLRAPSIVHDGKGRGRQPSPNISAALFSTVVRSVDHRKRFPYDLVEDALLMFQSAREVGSKLPMHLIAANLSPNETARFTAAGVSVHNFTHEVATVKGWYRPVYSPREAAAKRRIWVANNSVQRRGDGWATYFKYFAWKSAFDVVLHVDADFRFRTNIDELALAAARAGLSFVACPERFARQYDGLNTHAMILRPSGRTFGQIVAKASRGDYVPFTNTEQDVLECYFPLWGAVKEESFRYLCRCPFLRGVNGKHCGR